MEFSRCARARARPTENAGPRAGLSKLNSEGLLPGDTSNCVPGVHSSRGRHTSRRIECPDGMSHRDRLKSVPGNYHRMARRLPP